MMFSMRRLIRSSLPTPPKFFWLLAYAEVPPYRPLVKPAFIGSIIERVDRLDEVGTSGLKPWAAATSVSRSVERPIILARGSLRFDEA